MDWKPIQRPAELAESRMLEAILTGYFPTNSNLPGERELAEKIGVTRPTLREALQRLARDGWLDIQQGRPTRVCNYWEEGSLAVLSVLAQSPVHQPRDFVVHLLDLRTLLAPTYTRQAIIKAPDKVASLLEQYADLEESPAIFARADWDLHLFLVRNAANPVFQLLLNGFKSLYLLVGEQYFLLPESRRHSQDFYKNLLECARKKEAKEAETLTRRVMKESLALANKIHKGLG